MHEAVETALSTQKRPGVVSVTTKTEYRNIYWSLDIGLMDSFMFFYFMSLIGQHPVWTNLMVVVNQDLLHPYLYRYLFMIHKQMLLYQRLLVCRR